MNGIGVISKKSLFSSLKVIGNSSLYFSVGESEIGDLRFTSEIPDRRSEICKDIPGLGAWRLLKHPSPVFTGGAPNSSLAGIEPRALAL